MKYQIKVVRLSSSGDSVYDTHSEEIESDLSAKDITDKIHLMEEKYSKMNIVNICHINIEEIEAIIDNTKEYNMSILGKKSVEPIVIKIIMKSGREYISIVDNNELSNLNNKFNHKREV